MTGRPPSLGGSANPVYAFAMPQNTNCEPDVRSLIKSDIAAPVERIKAVPGLISLASDPKINEQTRSSVYQALREITGQRLPNDPGAWRKWYADHEQEAMQKFAAADAKAGTRK
jgi:hypothetical protein